MQYLYRDFKYYVKPASLYHNRRLITMVPDLTININSLDDFDKRRPNRPHIIYLSYSHVVDLKTTNVVSNGLNELKKLR